MNMNILTILNGLLANPWLVFFLSVAVVLLGWIVGGRLSTLLVRLAERFSLPGRIAYIFRLRDPKRVSVWIRWILRWLIFLASVWVAWRMLATHAEIVRITGELQRSIPGFLRLPAVMFLLDVALIGLATFLLVKLIGWVKKRFAALEAFLAAERGSRFSAWRIQRVQLLSAKQVADLAFRASRYFRYGINLLLVLGYLTGIFSLFPQTRGFVLGILNSMLQILSETWLGFLNYLPDLFTLIVIAVVTYFGLRFLHFLFREIERGTITLAGFYPEWAEPTFTIVRTLVIVLALVIAFPFMPGSSSPAFQGVSIFLGALLSLGSTSVVGNIVAGIILTYAQAFRVGDRVQIGETVGDVTGKGLIATRIRTIKNVDVTVPNGLVLANHIVNFSSEAEQRGLILHTTVTIGYDAPWRKVHETLIKAALATPAVLADPRPFVFQTSLDNSYVSYEINAYTREPLKMANIYSDLHQNIQDKFNEAGIEILSPQFGAVRDGNTSTIPADSRPADYQAPPFRVKIDRGK
jgi:small-conductance mechanosensitive channel